MGLNENHDHLLMYFHYLD